MRSPATGSLYGVLTFAILAAAFAVVTHQLFGWQPGPSGDRGQSTATLGWYAVAGLFAMKVGRHREVPYGEALRRGLIDVGRALKGVVMR